jgi:hypothetical protein
MNDYLSGKTQAQDLQQVWDRMVKIEWLHPEIAYRIEKLINRMAPLADKIYFKTVKAHQLLAECRQKTTALHNHIKSDGDNAFFLLTNLEKTFEDLLQKTYEFRVKAG